MTRQRCTYHIADHHGLPHGVRPPTETRRTLSQRDPINILFFNKPPRHLQAFSYQTAIPPTKSALDTELFSRSDDGIRSLL